MSALLKQIFAFLISSFVIFLLLFVFIFYFPNTKINNKVQSIYVPTDTTYSELLALISPYVRSEFSFRIAAKAKQFRTARPGHFLLEVGMGNQLLINTLRSKNTPVNVIFNNQQTVEHLAGRIAEQLEVDSLSLIQEFHSKSFLELVELNQQELLSFFIPNSYEMYWNVSAKEFCDRMLDEHIRFWNTNRELKRKLKKLSRAEVVNLAAIVNEESKNPDERPLVAGVYLNRLRKGMKLQADPTVVYAMKRKANNFDLNVRRVLYKDLKINSPYNTYKYRGLPPGPITMPDVNAIDAILDAEKHNYLYFVADPSNPGDHLFASTYAKHLKNRDVYVRWLNKKGIMH